MSKTAIVIGATGLVGTRVVRLLSQSDHISKVISLTRRSVIYTSSKIENHVLDFDRLSDYASLFEGDILFSCLGTTKNVAGSIEAQRLVDLEYQHQAASLAAQQGVAHYLLVSSSGANGQSMSPYLKMKGELEAKVQALPFDRVSIFQPSLLLGNRADVRIAENLASKVMPLMCLLPGLRRYRPIRAHQVAQKMVSVSAKPGSKLETFNLDEVFPD